MNNSPSSEYMRRSEILELARRHHIGRHSVEILFGPDCRARKVLPGCTRAVYVRRVVHELLGFSPEKAS